MANLINKRTYDLALLVRTAQRRILIRNAPSPVAIWLREKYEVEYQRINRRIAAIIMRGWY